ncbi:hypothetical protein Leryth_007193 [Lithospermum erythrorhizon]|uniref:Pectinesterase inhibitor domain-containing protein n=1 Tax=Lithospermum erythrorhizon TaxID=34254 RepID=A0AAV3PT37_LITER|nr:hypothetical protein Leryth_007193 [Lithospermum erythrorhizon]
MAKITLISIFFLLLSFLVLVRAVDFAKPTYRRHSRTRVFVKEQCQTTRYPKLCVHCLSSHVSFSTTQNHQQLAHIALLKVSLVRANYARTYLINVATQLKQVKAKEYQTIKDCLDQINDGVRQLTKSVKEMPKINVEDDEYGFVWYKSNVQSWASAALTDTLTCMDGFSGYPMGGKTRAIVKAKVLNVAQVTSNALALFNRYVAKQRATYSHKPQP